MDTTKNVLFPKVFRGYEPNAVNEYILNTNKSFVEELKNLQDKLSEFTSDSKNNSVIIAELRSSIEKLSEENNSLKEENREARVKSESLVNDVIKKRDETILSLSNQLAKEKEDHASKMTALEESFINKFEEFFLQETTQNEILANIESESIRIRQEISTLLKELTKKCLIRTLSEIENTTNDLSRISKSLTENYEGMTKSIDDYESDTMNEIKRVLSDFKKNLNE